MVINTKRDALISRKKKNTNIHHQANCLMIVNHATKYKVYWYRLRYRINIALTKDTALTVAYPRTKDAKMDIGFNKIFVIIIYVVIANLPPVYQTVINFYIKKMT